MRLPSASREDVLKAMRQFDASDHSPSWPQSDKDWTEDRRHGWAIDHAGRLYPVKELVRLTVREATGDWPPEEFWGGSQANGYMTRLGFEPIPRSQWDAARQSPHSN